MPHHHRQQKSSHGPRPTAQPALSLAGRSRVTFSAPQTPGHHVEIHGRTEELSRTKSQLPTWTCSELISYLPHIIFEPHAAYNSFSRASYFATAYKRLNSAFATLQGGYLANTYSFSGEPLAKTSHQPCADPSYLSPQMVSHCIQSSEVAGNLRHQHAHSVNGTQSNAARRRSAAK